MKIRYESKKGYEELKVGDYAIKCEFPTEAVVSMIKEHPEVPSTRPIVIPANYVTLFNDGVFVDGLGGLLIDGLGYELEQQFQNNGKLLRVDLIPNGATWRMFIWFRSKASAKKGKKKV